MGITDRVILTLYTIVMAAIAVVLILITFGILPVDYFISEIAALPGNWEYAAGGAVILLISVRLLMAGIGLLGDDSTLTLADADTGKTVVSKRALEDYIADIAQEVYGIYGVKVAVTMEDKDTIDARIKASLEPTARKKSDKGGQRCLKTYSQTSGLIIAAASYAHWPGCSSPRCFSPSVSGGRCSCCCSPAEAFLSATKLIKKKTWQSGWTGCCRRAIINSRPA